MQLSIGVEKFLRADAVYYGTGKGTGCAHRGEIMASASLHCQSHSA